MFSNRTIIQSDAVKGIEQAILEKDEILEKA